MYTLKETAKIWQPYLTIYMSQNNEWNKKREKFSRGRFMLLKSIEYVVLRFKFQDRKNSKLKCWRIPCICFPNIIYLLILSDMSIKHSLLQFCYIQMVPNQLFATETNLKHLIKVFCREIKCLADSLSFQIKSKKVFLLQSVLK